MAPATPTVLMITTEYPPLIGGIGRYSSKLTRALQKLGVRVFVVCDEKGMGNFSGISPRNEQNSEVLLKIVKEVRPDIVHVQFEPGLYGLTLDPSNSEISGTNIDNFYRQCKTPIITTFHSVYSLKQWMKEVTLIKRDGRTGKIGIPARMSVRIWNRILTYRSFQKLNEEKLRLSRGAIVFSHYVSKLLGGGQVIYHGAEPSIDSPGKRKARALFALPTEGRIVLALGLRSPTKGWDVLEKMRLPEGWTMVVNSSQGHYSEEKYVINWKKRMNVIDLNRNYLTDEQLSLLLYASDSVILPYKITAGSGVMFDALAHGIPFIATNLEFFQEFSSLNLGIAVKREPIMFYEALRNLDAKYSIYLKAVNDFRDKLKWEFVAKQHLMTYNNVISNRLS